MATSAQSIEQAPTSAGYEQAMDYSSFVEKDQGDDWFTRNIMGDGFLGYTFGNLSGMRQREHERYNAYIQALNKRNEERAIANARAYDEWFESTKYQRAIQDLRKAGLNPWLAVNSGFANQSSASTTNSSAKGVEYELKETKGALASLLGAIAKLIG